MKSILILFLISLLSVIGLTGCWESKNDDSVTQIPPYVGEEEPMPFAKVQNLPEKVEKLLNDAGINNILFVPIVNSDGEIFLLKSINAEIDPDYPEETIKNIKELEKVVSISVVNYKKSNCQLINLNGMYQVVCS